MPFVTTTGFSFLSLSSCSPKWSGSGAQPPAAPGPVLLLLSRTSRWLTGKESTCQCGRCRRRRFHPWVTKIPWRRKWQPTPVFQTGRSHGQRSLALYSTRGCKECDMTEQPSIHTRKGQRNEDRTCKSVYFLRSREQEACHGPLISGSLAIWLGLSLRAAFCRL